MNNLIQFYNNRIIQLDWLLTELRDAETDTDIIEFGKHIEPLYYSEPAISYSVTFDAAQSSGEFSKFKKKELLKLLTQYYTDFKLVSNLTTTTLRIVEKQLEPLIATIPENFITRESGTYVYAIEGINDFYNHIGSIKDNRNISIDLESFLQKPEFENYIIGDLGRSYNANTTFKARQKSILLLRDEIYSRINN